MFCYFSKRTLINYNWQILVQLYFCTSNSKNTIYLLKAQNSTFLKASQKVHYCSVCYIGKHTCAYALNNAVPAIVFLLRALTAEL